jgi:hypothetical protein
MFVRVQRYLFSAYLMVFSPMVLADSLLHWSKQSGLDIAKQGERISSSDNIYEVAAPNVADFVSVKKERSKYFFLTYQSFRSASDCFSYMDSIMVPEVKSVVGSGAFSGVKEKGDQSKRLMIKKNPNGTSFAIMCGTDDMKLTHLGKYAEKIVNQYKKANHAFWGGLLLRWEN